jgi:anaerobic ribonucleoside-triphosphate reductase activating protein
MVKYYNSMVVFEEIPDEITLAINITNCPCHCPDCHSKFLWEDIGTELTNDELDRLIKANDGITCVCFMGGDAEPSTILLLASNIKMEFPKLKVGWYSGMDSIAVKAEHYLCLDYIKTGPFIKERGGLNNPNTNQHLYKKEYSDSETRFNDITYKFWKAEEKSAVL